MVLDLLDAFHIFVCEGEMSLFRRLGYRLPGWPSPLALPDAYRIRLYATGPIPLDELELSTRGSRMQVLLLVIDKLDKDL